MSSKEVKIAGKSYPLAYNLRAIVLFEKIADKPFAVAGVTEWIVLIYACLLAANKELDVTLDEFIDTVEQAEISTCIAWLSKQMEVNKQVSGDETDEKPKKKSRSAKSTG